MPQLTRRNVITGALVTLFTPGFWALQGAQPAAAALPFRRTFTIGRSVQGRKIKVRRLGPPHRPVRMVIVGCIHGNEDDGRRIVEQLYDWTPPKNTTVYLISTMNPDGNVASDGNALNLRGRLNARGVNLNRNFPGGIRTGKRGRQTYSGPRDLSEPESRAVHKFLVEIDPRVLVVYHQHMNLIDFCGGNKGLQRAYAKRTKQRFTQLKRYRGSMATWYHKRRPKATVMTVELDVTTPATLVRRHRKALKRFIRDYAAKAAKAAEG